MLVRSFVCSRVARLTSAASSQADKVRRMIDKYAPGQQTKKNRVNSIINNLIRDFESNKRRFSLSNTTDKKPERKNSKARDSLYKLCLHRFLEDKVKESVANCVLYAHPPLLVACHHKLLSGHVMSKANRLNSHASTRKRQYLLLKMLYIKNWFMLGSIQLGRTVLIVGGTTSNSRVFMVARQKQVRSTVYLFAC